jgi:hypothetical protein
MEFGSKYPIRRAGRRDYADREFGLTGDPVAVHPVLGDLGTVIEELSRGAGPARSGKTLA